MSRIKNLWETIFGYRFDEGTQEDFSLILSLKNQGIKVNYSERANDPFFVWLHKLTYSISDFIYTPDELLKKCKIFKNLKENDNITYFIVIRLPNGYDIAWNIEDKKNRYTKISPEIFAANGKKVTNTPIFEYAFNAEYYDCIFDFIYNLTPDAHFTPGYEVWFKNDKDECWREIYDTDNFLVAKLEIEKERDKLKKIYG